MILSRRDRAGFVLFAERSSRFTGPKWCVRGGVLRTVSLDFSSMLTACNGQAFNGAGAVWTPTFINFFCFWLCNCARLRARAPAGMDARRVCSSPSRGHLRVVSATIFKRGRWKLKKV